jgi:hypothetical protein
MSCGAPEAQAHGLMSYDEERSSCFFERQPTTPEEEYRAIRAIWASCCGAVRYGGSDPSVIARLESLESGRVGNRGDLRYGVLRIRTKYPSPHRREHGEYLPGFHHE